MSPAQKMAVKVFRVEGPGNLRNLIEGNDYSVIFTSSNRTHEERCSMCVGMRMLETLYIFDCLFKSCQDWGGREDTENMWFSVPYVFLYHPPSHSFTVKSSKP